MYLITPFRVPELHAYGVDREWEKGEYLKSALTNLTADVRTYWVPFTAPFINILSGGGVNTDVTSWGWQGAYFGNGKRDWALDSIGVPGANQDGKKQIGRRLLSMFRIDASVPVHVVPGQVHGARP
jgi:hypothetical protein